MKKYYVWYKHLNRFMRDEDTGERIAISEYVKEAAEKHWETDHIEFIEKEMVDKSE